eukprot:CAMPEP_0116063066 /NCGR_PEP_ID=MMETSP0322-20121206/8174_1 /TAXON_ID=163516 /ORGANISM="Leptocylindrus danicus var. apora, Strain B651" /LENGTH=632 /DNA_ID=CAMNT_0003548575 /DNA_START=84 /DNA_END=1982 /DNA_ORIENTATION=+
MNFQSPSNAEARLNEDKYKLANINTNNNQCLNTSLILTPCDNHFSWSMIVKNSKSDDEFNLVSNEGTLRSGRIFSHSNEVDIFLSGFFLGNAIMFSIISTEKEKSLLSTDGGNTCLGFDKGLVLVPCHQNNNFLLHISMQPRQSIVESHHTLISRHLTHLRGKRRQTEVDKSVGSKSNDSGTTSIGSKSRSGGDNYEVISQASESGRFESGISISQSGSLHSGGLHSGGGSRLGGSISQDANSDDSMSNRSMSNISGSSKSRSSNHDSATSNASYQGSGRPRNSKPESFYTVESTSYSSKSRGSTPGGTSGGSKSGTSKSYAFKSGSKTGNQYSKSGVGTKSGGSKSGVGYSYSYYSEGSIAYSSKSRGSTPGGSKSGTSNLGSSKTIVSKSSSKSGNKSFKSGGGFRTGGGTTSRSESSVRRTEIPSLSPTNGDDPNTLSAPSISLPTSDTPEPSQYQTLFRTDVPTKSPSIAPSTTQTFLIPTSTPALKPSNKPTTISSEMPTTTPTKTPSSIPTSNLTATLSITPSSMPTVTSSIPSYVFSSVPTPSPTKSTFIEVSISRRLIDMELIFECGSTIVVRYQNPNAGPDQRIAISRADDNNDISLQYDSIICMYEHLQKQQLFRDHNKWNG